MGQWPVEGNLLHIIVSKQSFPVIPSDSKSLSVNYDTFRKFPMESAWQYPGSFFLFLLKYHRIITFFKLLSETAHIS